MKNQNLEALKVLTCNLHLSICELILLMEKHPEIAPQLGKAIAHLGLATGPLDDVLRNDLVDTRVLQRVSEQPIGLADLERCPPPDVTPDEARISAQRLVGRGVLGLDVNLRLSVGGL